MTSYNYLPDRELVAQKCQSYWQINLRSDSFREIALSPSSSLDFGRWISTQRCTWPSLISTSFMLAILLRKIELEMSAAKGTPLRTPHHFGRNFRVSFRGGALISWNHAKMYHFWLQNEWFGPKRKKRQNRDHQLMPKGPSRRWSEKNPTQMMLQQLASRSLDFDGFCNFDRPLKPQNTSRLAHRSASCMMAVNLSSCRSTIRESCWGESDNGGEMEDTTMAISMTKLMIQTNWTSGKWW